MSLVPWIRYASTITNTSMSKYTRMSCYMGAVAAQLKRGKGGTFYASSDPAMRRCRRLFVRRWW